MIRKFLFILLISTLSTRTVAASPTLQVIREEQQVNQQTIGLQDHATVAMYEDGSSLIVWHDFNEPDGDSAGIVARLFDENGSSLRDEFLINDAGMGSQRVPDIATAGSQPYVVTWDSILPGESYDVLGKVLSPAGDEIVNDFHVNDQQSKTKNYPDVAMYDNGDFLVIWDHTIYGKANYYVKLFNINGTLLAGPYRINTIESMAHSVDNDTYGLADIAVNKENGDAVAVWERIDENDNVVIAGRKFNPYNLTASTERVIDLPPEGVVQRRPMVDMNRKGDILICWNEHTTADISTSSVIVKKYSQETLFSEAVIPHGPEDEQNYHPVIKLSDEGDYIILWSQNDDIVMRLYNRFNNPDSEIIIVNDTIAGVQRRPAVDWRKSVETYLMIVTWESFSQDGSESGVFSKLFEITY